MPRQQKAAAAVELIRDTTNELIKKCKAMVDEEEVSSPNALQLVTKYIVRRVKKHAIYLHTIVWLLCRRIHELRCAAGSSDSLQLPMALADLASLPVPSAFAMHH